MEDQEDAASVAESVASVALQQPDCSAAQSFAGLRERPILFSGPMVRALLDGRKTQTRRMVKPQPGRVFSPGSAFPLIGEIYAYNSPSDGWMLVRAGRQPRENALVGRCPYGVPGDLLWVREAWSAEWSWRHEAPRDIIPCAPIWYWADGDPTERDWTRPKPSIHMPRWASRITLRITDVRVERLNDCSEADASAEGIQRYPDGFHWERNAGWPGEPAGLESARFVGLTGQQAYRGLWEHINGPGSWDANPWVWAVTFEQVAPSSEEPTSRVRRAEPELSTLPGISS